MADVDAGVRRWINENAERGCTPSSMIDALVVAGHNRAFAEEAVAQVLIEAQTRAGAALVPESVATAEPTASRDARVQHLAEQALALAEARSAGPRLAVPEPLPHGSAGFVQTADRRIPVLATLAAPRVIVFGGVLSDAECDELVRLSASKLERSRIVDPQTGVASEHRERTSDGTYFTVSENQLVAAIDRRIAELMRWPIENGEGLQILHYAPGGEYKPHFDYFDPADPGSAPHLAKGGNRVATLVIYLSSVEAGGGTVFPDIGFEVAATKGCGVFFSYDSPTPASLTLHGGAPVVRGEKWIATKWVRERAFR
jgi:prolyl 4-hydroxylase